MKKLLDSFFRNILSIDVSIAQLSPTLYACIGEELDQYSYQASFLQMLLLNYGLSNVVKFDKLNDATAVIIDFDAKWEDDIERSSKIFLPQAPLLWDQHRLDYYAASIDEAGLWNKRTRLASNLLLLLNFRTEVPKAWTCVAELTPRQDLLLTFNDPQATTLYIESTATQAEVVSNGTYAKAFHTLAKPIVRAFLAQAQPKVEIQFNATLQSVAMGELSLTSPTLDNLLNSKVAAVVATKRPLLEALKSLLDTAKELSA